MQFCQGQLVRIINKLRLLLPKQLTNCLQELIIAVLLILFHYFLSCNTECSSHFSGLWSSNHKVGSITRTLWICWNKKRLLSPHPRHHRSPLSHYQMFYLAKLHNKCTNNTNWLTYRTLMLKCRNAWMENAWISIKLLTTNYRTYKRLISTLHQFLDVKLAVNACSLIFWTHNYNLPGQHDAIFASIPMNIYTIILPNLKNPHSPMDHTNSPQSCWDFPVDPSLSTSASARKFVLSATNRLAPVTISQ